MTSTRGLSLFFILVVLLDVLIVLVAADKLANSGYPIKGANAQRNNKINRGILCPDVAPGRTTVLAEVWNSFGLNIELQTPFLDGQGGIYIYTTTDESVSRLNVSNGFKTGKIGSQPGPITLSEAGLAFVSPASSTFVFDWTKMTTVTTVPNESTGGINAASMVPYKTKYMLRANFLELVLPAVSFLDTDYFNWSNSQPQVTPGVSKDILVFTDSGGNDHFLAIGDLYDPDDGLYRITIKSDLYSVNVTDHVLSFADDVAPFIADNVLYIVAGDSITHRFHAINGSEILPPISPPPPYTIVRNGIVHNGKYVVNANNGGSYFRTVELFTNTTVHDSYAFSGSPTFSIPDEVLVFPGYLRDEDSLGHVQVVAIDWNDWSIRAIGELPEVGNDPSATEVVIGDNCQAHVIVGNVGSAVLRTLEPLPIQPIVPILECIDENQVAHFTYENLGSRTFRMPFVEDRNNLQPTGRAPASYFVAGQGPHYPLSFSLNLTSYIGQNVSWLLEDYTLSFVYSETDQSLKCPTSINITILLRSTSTFKVGVIGPAVRDAFVTVTQIRSDRVSVLRVGSPKRSIVQTNDLEVELQVEAGNSTEPSAAEVVREFVESGQTDFTNELNNTPGVPPETTVENVSTKEIPTAVRGTPNPVPEVPSTEIPATSSPTFIPSNVSSAVITKISTFIMVVCLLLA